MDRKKLINIGIGVVIAGLLVWLFFRGTDWQAVGDAFAAADVELLLLAMVFHLASAAVKSYRWQLLLGGVIPGVSVHTCFKYFNIGFALITLIPGRVGEVLRPYLLAKEKKVRFLPTFATVITERVLDMLIVFAMFSTVFFLPQILGESPDESAVEMLRGAGVVTLAIAVFLLVLLVLIKVKTELAIKIFHFFGRILPKKISEKIEEMISTFADGLSGLSSLPKIVALVTSTALGWGLGVIFFWLSFQAFGLEAPWYFFFLLQAATAFGVALPTPAGAGGYHMAISLVAFSLWGMDRSVVQATAISTHLMIFGSLTLIGVAYLLSGGINIFSASKEVAEEPEAEQR